MNIVLKGIEEYPRYNENHIVGKFNKYLDNNFYRFVIMKSIQDPYKFRDFHKIIEEAIEWAQLCDYELPEKEELKALERQKLLYNLHCKNCENYNEKNSLKWCPGCAIRDEFLEIGEVLDKTITEKRKCFVNN